jgi:shikimate 5-dehydrogenase
MLLHQAPPGFKEWCGVEPKITNEIRKRILTQ